MQKPAPVLTAIALSDLFAAPEPSPSQSTTGRRLHGADKCSARIHRKKCGYGVLLCAALAVAGCDKAPDARPDIHSGVYLDAEEVAKEACTNDVVGFRKVVFITVDKTTKDAWPEQDPNLWAAKAEVEYVNRLGGMERDTFYIRFHGTGSYLGANVLGPESRFHWDERPGSPGKNR